MPIELGTVLTDEAGVEYMIVSNNRCTHFPTVWQYELMTLPSTDPEGEATDD